MSFCDSPISHSSCESDSNCGLTCSQLYAREVSSDPSFVPPPGHYEDFMTMCSSYYFPGGCSGVSSGSSPGQFVELSPAVIDSLDRFFLDGFHGGIVFSLPYLSALVCVLLACYLLVSSTKEA